MTAGRIERWRDQRILRRRRRVHVGESVMVQRKRREFGEKCLSMVVRDQAERLVGWSRAIRLLRPTALCRIGEHRRARSKGRRLDNVPEGNVRVAFGPQNADQLHKTDGIAAQPHEAVFVGDLTSLGIISQSQDSRPSATSSIVMRRRCKVLLFLARFLLISRTPVTSLSTGRAPIPRFSETSQRFPVGFAHPLCRNTRDGEPVTRYHVAWELLADLGLEILDEVDERGRRRDGVDSHRTGRVEVLVAARSALGVWVFGEESGRELEESDESRAERGRLHLVDDAARDGRIQTRREVLLDFADLDSIECRRENQLLRVSTKRATRETYRSPFTLTCPSFRPRHSIQRSCSPSSSQGAATHLPRSPVR